jgi:hypothetical protein
MSLTLAQGAQMIASAGYAARVRGAMVRAALTVSTEVQGGLTSSAWLKRRQLAGQILKNPDAYLIDFQAAIAADQFTPLTWYNPTVISSSTNVNPSVITTGVVHGLTTGDVVEIVGHLVNTNVNGVWVATVITTTTFSVPNAANGVGGATGTVMRMDTDSNLVSDANQVFSPIAGLLPGE